MEADDKSHDFLSESLEQLMQDYFNRYDLDGSQSINSSEELKQLCTNLVVKLDLPMDVGQIDAVVNKAGRFVDDNPKAENGEGNNWDLTQFKNWFCAAGHFDVDRNWMAGDQSDEDEEPSDAKPFLEGTYIGTLEGGGKKYTIKRRIGGKINAKTKKLENYHTEECHEFMFKIRRDTNDPTKLLDRVGCDAIGYHKTNGSIDGTKIVMVVAYDIDNDADTKEPRIELTGEWGGPGDEDKWKIKGTWKNTEAEHEDAAKQMDKLGLEGVQEGTFELTKRIRDDEEA